MGANYSMYNNKSRLVYNLRLHYAIHVHNLTNPSFHRNGPNSWGKTSPGIFHTDSCAPGNVNNRSAVSETQCVR
jgi:hypothetical protein